MNLYTQNLNRIEFIITFACTGRCKHCSEGDHLAYSEYIDGDAAARAVYKTAGKYNINSLMTFGGEPLLHPDVVCKIHAAAKEMNIPKRQLITNGFFSKDRERIKSVAKELRKAGVNEIALSVDAFHQETIPLEPVKEFAKAVAAEEITIHTHPAWLIGKEAENIYNIQTIKILEEFEFMGITASDGNIIFPSGNALKYLKEYFDLNVNQISPYDENPEDIQAICIEPDGSVLNDNIFQTDILDILNQYKPYVNA